MAARAAPPRGRETHALRTQGRRTRALVPGAVLALAVIAAGAWLTRPKGSAPAIEERAVALPPRPPAIAPAATPPPTTPPPTTPSPTVAPPMSPALPAAPPASPPAAAASAAPAGSASGPPGSIPAPEPAIAAPEPGADALPSLFPPSLFPSSLGALDGFGSARFEMTEPEIRDAIDRDFPSADHGRRRFGPIDVEADRVFLTRALLAAVRDVLPGSGPARVEYILGYQRHRLIQVNIIWGTPADPSTPRADIEAVAAQLQDFVARAYGTSARTAVMQPDGSVVHFVGRDRQGRMVELASSLRLPQHYWVRLSYVEDPLTGDVYRVPRGAF